jgi:prephenate dehydrogenase
MWRDVALTNKKNIRHALLKLEQRLAHIRENLDTRELAIEFERAHLLKKHLRKASPQRHRGTEKTKK